MRLCSLHRTVAAAAAFLIAATAVLVNPVTAPPAAVAGTTPTSTLAAPFDFDYRLGECSDILPPGQNGHATLAEILLHQAFGTMPPHSADQIDKYADLLHHYTGLTPPKSTPSSTTPRSASRPIRWRGATRRAPM